ncbi:hypothetical protein F5148DRAFT_1210170 [Russula earlei]|uniref:Uncharacterized protein n=1 Tax=Russula earlei TaxID=71964 RepID=A0ACC0U6U7_9AGAM|nr:hypothetical protein F5148DRAFT_1210170 [Russula earlei]
MILLHWSTLQPAGPSNLAALRFSSPVRVRSLRIFPKNAIPFADQLDIVSETEPEAFVLEVFFNAHPISGDSKQKPKTTNALVPTSIAYAGGYAEFLVDMGNEFASRLMIVKGDFAKLSMAIYGDVAAELPSPPTSYVPGVLPPFTPAPLPPVLDPANSGDPTTLTRNLLSLIPNAPPLPLVIRLMFCLKPTNDDWDLPEFPYLHPDLSDDPVDFDLEYAYQLASQPVADDVPLDVLQRFADRVAAAIEPKNVNHPYLVAGILSRAACQHRELPRLLIDRIDLHTIFESSITDEDTLDHLLVAAANPDIAKEFTAANLPKELEAVASRQGVDSYVKRAAQRVIDRLRGWETLSAAIQNPDLLSIPVREILQDLGSDESSFGVTLHALVTHTDLAATIAEAEGLMELRAWVGVACVLAAYAWADSVPNELCRSRAFGILRVWQSSPSYRETLNHLLLLRQMIFRLECMMDDDTPTRSGIQAEHILYDLTRDPRAFLSPHLTKCLLQLQPGFSVINDTERAALRGLAILADDGLPAALEELLRTPTQPVSADALRTLRVATVLLSHELETGDSGTGEWAAVNALWEQHKHGLPLHLLAILDTLTADAQAHFSLIPPPHHSSSSSHAELASLLAGADELLQVLARLLPTHSLPTRAVNGLVNATADLFASADAAGTLNSVSMRVAQGLRGTCIDIVRSLDLELVLRALLRRGADIAGASAAMQDPVRRARHALDVVDLVLSLMPNTPSSETLRRALPRILPELATFFRALDVDGRAHLVRRLAVLDGGVLGIAEWLVLDELRALCAALRVLAAEETAPDLWTVKAHQVVTALRLLHGLMQGTAPEALRIVTFVLTEPEPAGLLVMVMNLLSADRAASQAHFDLAQVLVQSCSNIGAAGPDRSLCFALALVFLRAVQHVPLTLTPISYALVALRQVPLRIIEPDRLSTELGDALLVLASLSSNPNSNPNTATSSSSLDGIGIEAPAILSLLEWLVEQSHAGLPQLATLRGISTDTFAQLCDALARALPTARRATLEHVRMHLHTAPEEDVSLRSLNTFPLPTADVRVAIEQLLHPPPTLHQAPDAPIVAGQHTHRATTPPHARGVLSMVTVSPPTALLRSPAVTGLTKTYTANDFRALRQLPSARQNTSRLPSTHVDEFQSTMTSPVMVPMPIQVLPSNPYGMGLGPPFGS